MPVTLTVALQLDAGESVRVALRGKDPALSLAGDRLKFELTGGAQAYLASHGRTRFDEPPIQTAVPLDPGGAYVLRGSCRLSGGEAALWLIQYDESRRLSHARLDLADGAFALRWVTDPAVKSCVLALRVAGQGQLELSDLVLAPAARETPGEVVTGPAAAFRKYSVFFDPAGYKPYVARHHRFYDSRTPDWYAGLAQELAGARDVLELGCGPGLLLEALRNAGVSRPIGLERDPVYLGRCREHGLEVHEHDLNRPFPFLPSAAFDAVISHYALDYLAPIALRVAARESLRVLRPGGRFLAIARNDGQGSGDATRSSVPLGEPLVRRLLTEAGFDDVRIQVREQRIRFEGRRPVNFRCWPTQVISLATGEHVQPWQATETVLAAEPAAWDNASVRDFTLLTTAQKDELRVDGRLVAYYTAYHDEGGGVARGVGRAVSDDGRRWVRDPAGPVLQAGTSGAWDSGGVAAGSVLPASEPNGRRLMMYYTGRDADGVWPGIGLAFSDDGVTWEKRPERVLRVEDFPGLRYLALADVLRLASGRWLMHCEGWLDRGWAVVQAESEDGLRWRPAQVEPVLAPAAVRWGGRHAANPKCLELAPGHLLLGFNAAGAARDFQLGLAESVDGRAWRELPVNPVLCTSAGHRVESFFLTRDAWRRGDQQVYYFEADSDDTFRTSRVCRALADPAAAWVGPPWHSARPGLYRVRDDALQILPGARGAAQALLRTVELRRETQLTLRLGHSEGRSAATLVIETAAGEVQVAAAPTGAVSLDGAALAPAADENAPLALALRVIRPQMQPELELVAWHGTRLVAHHHAPLPAQPRCLRIALAVPPEDAPLQVDHCDLWQPATLAVDGCADAHMGMGVTGTGDPLLPDIDAAEFLAQLDREGIGRAVVVSYGAQRPLDTFDEADAARARRPGRILPFLRVSTERPRNAADEQFLLNQLELLWQQGRLGGLKVNLGRPERPAPCVLDWLEQRRVLTHWHAGAQEELNWLEEHVLRRFRFPVLVAHFGGYPLHRGRYSRCISWLDAYEQVYLVTSVVFYSAYLARAIERHPDRVLLGSDFPGIDVGVARSAIECLPGPSADDKALVLAENLRFVAERAAWERWTQLQRTDALRFPKLPESAAEVLEQGFEVVAPEQMPTNEDQQAKGYWSQHVSDFYLKPKPWSVYVADLAADLGARSVLEFGCHAGRNLATIAERLPGAALAGLDINAAAVARGCEHFDLDLRVGDEGSLADLPEGAFDLVFTVSVLDHIPSIDGVCRELLRVAQRYALFIEVTLPLEGKVVRHFDHQERRVRASTAASYSWQVDRFLRGHPRLWRLDCRPTYVQAGSLGPYYVTYLAYLRPPSSAAAGQTT